MNRYLSLAFFLLLVVVAAWTGGSFETGAWYEALIKPAWTPPNWVFGPAWGLIYVLMALAAWQVWLRRGEARLGAIAWWLIILLLNVAWSWLMFGLHRPGWAFMVAVLIFAFAVMCSRAFYLQARPAGFMMTPLVLWTAFACVLNYAIWSMNGGGVGRLLG